jgi:hypothetical protein
VAQLLKDLWINETDPELLTLKNWKNNKEYLNHLRIRNLLAVMA